MVARKYRSYTKELLEPLVRESRSFSDVLRGLGLCLTGGNHSHISSRIKTFELDTSHFRDPRDNLRGGSNRLDAKELLVKSRLNRREKAATIRRAMIDSGVKYQCNGCGNEGSWRGKPLRLEVDHINEDPTDNRLENLQLLCPNCHGQKTLGM